MADKKPEGTSKEGNTPGTPLYDALLRERQEAARREVEDSKNENATYPGES